MNPLQYHRANSPDAAVQAQAAGRNSRFLAGGTNLVDLLKYGVEQADEVVDINRLALGAITALPNGGLRLGATARNSHTAAHPLVRAHYPLLSQTILAGASAQLRNMATNGGNLLQRTRCYYFYDVVYQACNKRNPGSGCAAIGGYNRVHGILGTNPACIATHPSDMCIALAVLDAEIRVTGPEGPRTIPFADFHTLAGDTPEVENTLRPHELILSIDLPASPYAEHSHYEKVRDRTSYAFALVSVAAALELDGNIIRSARLAMGGVAHKPWRAYAAEAALADQPATTESFRAAAELALADATPQPTNAFKVPLAKDTIVYALETAVGKALEP